MHHPLQPARTGRTAAIPVKQQTPARHRFYCNVVSTARTLRSRSQYPQDMPVRLGTSAFVYKILYSITFSIQKFLLKNPEDILGSNKSEYGLL